MRQPLVTIGTARLVLRPFTDMDKDALFELHAHPAVAESLGSTPTRAQSDALADFCNDELAREGFAFWAVDVVDAGHRDGTGAMVRPAAVGPGFIGMVGLHRVAPALPCAPAVEVGWRLHPDSWGHGYATEAAAAALRHGFAQVGLEEVVAFTSVGNTRSQAVMVRLGLERDPGGDFAHPGLPEESPLRPHVLYRIHRSQSSRTLSP